MKNFMFTVFISSIATKYFLVQTADKMKRGQGRIAPIGGDYTRDTIQNDAPDTPECTPGEKKGKGCRSCDCSDDGRWLCKGFCPLSSEKAECSPGEKKGKGCRSCDCSDDGQWLCKGFCPLSSEKA